MTTTPPNLSKNQTTNSRIAHLLSVPPAPSSAYSQDKNYTKKIMMLLKTALQSWLLHQLTTQSSSYMLWWWWRPNMWDKMKCFIGAEKKQRNVWCRCCNCNQLANSSTNISNKPAPLNWSAENYYCGGIFFFLSSVFTHSMQYTMQCHAIRIIFWEPGARCSIQWKCKVD